MPVSGDPPVIDLRDAVARWVRSGRERWPAIQLDEKAFRSHLLAVGQHAPAFPLDAFLAAACAVGDPAALAAFDRELIAQVPGMIRRIDASDAFGVEICQA